MYEKMLTVQAEIIKAQEREINELRESKRLLAAANATLAEALDRALHREGRDRVFIPAKELQSGATFRVEQTIDGDLLIVRA